MKTKEELYQEIEKLKEVNLVDFVCSTANFRLDEDRIRKENKNIDNPKYVFVENDSGEKLLISRIYNEGRQQYVYKNLYNDFDKGNILSFIKNRSENYSIPTAKKKIYNYLNNVEKGYYKNTPLKITLEETDYKTINETSLVNLKNKYLSLPNFRDMTYLKSRGLSEEILKSHLCENRIKNEFIYGKKILSGSKPPIQYVNTVFPIYAMEGDKALLCGYVRKNENLKLTEKDSFASLGVWASGYKRDQPITQLIIGENPIDVLSYCQDKIDYKKENPLLVATNGELTKTQIKLINELVSRLCPETIILANDNDPRGQTFNAKILASLPALPYSTEKSKDISNTASAGEMFLKNIEVFAGRRDALNGELIWKLHHDKISNDKELDSEKLAKNFPQLQKIVNYYNGKNEVLFLKNLKEHYSEIKVSFYNSAANWIEINKSIIDLKFDSDIKLKLEVPIYKDFNEDLKVKLGIVKNMEVDNKNDVELKIN
jgi:hypothetical protein